MLDYSILKPEGILLIKPQMPLRKEDFADLSAAVDAYLAEHTTLHGVMIHTKGFPGWEDFDGFTAHMHFVRDHHQKVERVAIVTDSPFARLAESLGQHFTSAVIQRFPYADEGQALDWLKST